MDTDTVATPEDLAAIVRAASVQVNFMKWLASRLRTSPAEEYRTEAAKLLDWIVDGVQ